MTSAPGLFAAYVGVSVRGQLQYRASFVMQVAAQFFLMAGEFLAVWTLFSRFGTLRGWTLAEVALLYGMANVAFAISETSARGFDIFPGIVRAGDFDFLLLRPRSTALQVAGLEFRLRYVGRLLQGLVVLGWALSALHVQWTVAKALLFVASLVGGACLFSGLFVLQATFAFWTVESLELINTVTYGGVETAQYPLSIYRGWFRNLFTFVIPLACLNYFPALALLDRPDELGFPVAVRWLSPALGVVFLLVCLRAWEFGVRHYRSTGT